MSPSIRIVPVMEPSQRFFRGLGAGVTTSATGSPNLVTRMGRRVLRTRSRRARQVALNFEMAISSIPVRSLSQQHFYHSQKMQADM